MDLQGMFFTACWVRFYHLWQFFRNFFLYYLWHPRFFLADMLILSKYFFRSPYRIIRNYDETHRNHSIGPYGETDFLMMARLLDECGIPSSASIADLGAGRGRLSFFLRMVRGHTKVYAVEFHPLFVKRAEWVCKLLHIRNLMFLCDDVAKVYLPLIDVVYIYTLIIDEEEFRRLARHMSYLDEKTKIITISTWLGEALPGHFLLEKTIPVRFEWGKTEAFLQHAIHV